MVKQAQQNTGAATAVPRVADGGYGSGSQQEQLSQRGRIVERHFGHIKQHDGLRRWTVRGFENVRTQWALINLTMNLRVLAKHWVNQKQQMN